MLIMQLDRFLTLLAVKLSGQSIIRLLDQLNLVYPKRIKESPVLDL